MCYAIIRPTRPCYGVLKSVTKGRTGRSGVTCVTLNNRSNAVTRSPAHVNKAVANKQVE